MRKGKICFVHLATGILLVVGALNWGVIGAFDWNFIEAVFGKWPVLVQVFYVFFGMAAVIEIVPFKCSLCFRGKAE